MWSALLVTRKESLTCSHIATHRHPLVRVAVRNSTTPLFGKSRLGNLVLKFLLSRTGLSARVRFQKRLISDLPSILAV